MGLHESDQQRRPTIDPTATIPTRRALFRLFLHERHDPEPFYRAVAARTFADFGLPLDGRSVLDLGSGDAVNAGQLAARGADVVALDRRVERAALAAAVDVRAVAGDAQQLPFRDQSFDGVFCSNLLEHLPDHRSALDEIARVLTPGGWAWVSWTNWLSPVGGHRISPLHYLGPRIGSRVHSAVFGEFTGPHVYDGLWPLHIGTVLRDLRDHPTLRVRAAVPRYYPRQRWLLRVPGVREVATWNCALTLERTGAV